MENVIELINVRKDYKGFTLKNVSFTVPKGAIMGLIGPNGAGKTTVIKLMMNLIRRDGGDIKIFGRDIRRDEVFVKSRIGFVYDEPKFPDDISLKNITAAYKRFYADWDDQQYRFLIKEFELSMEKKFKKLSHGMKAKFSLALALSHHADLILMDEPTSGLDPIIRRKLLDRLADIMANQEKSILFSTHITSDLDRIADYITFIRDGEIVFSMTRDSLAENWGIIKGGEEILDNGIKENLHGFRRNRYGVEALVSDLPLLRKQLPRTAIAERASLEDIMYFMTKESTMLRNLLIQDYLFNKKLLVIYVVALPLFFVFYPLIAENGGIVVGFCFLYMGVLPSTIPAKEHRYQTGAVTCSLPVTRKQVVRSKYLAALTFCAGGIVLFLLISAVNPLLSFPRQQIFNLKTMATGIFVLSICLALFFPMIIRFGIMGIMVILIVLQLLGALLLLFAKMLSSAFRSGIDGVFDAVGGAFQYLERIMGYPGYPLFLLAAGCILITLSYLACVAIYRRKEF